MGARLAHAFHSPGTPLEVSGGSTATPVDTTNLRITVTLDGSTQIELVFSCPMVNSPAGGKLCVLEGSTIVASGQLMTPGGSNDPSVTADTIIPYVDVTVVDALLTPSAGVHSYDLAVQGHGSAVTTGACGSGFGIAMLEAWTPRAAA